jgi:hypothetical protein
MNQHGRFPLRTGDGKLAGHLTGARPAWDAARSTDWDRWEFQAQAQEARIG